MDFLFETVGIEFLVLLFHGFLLCLVDFKKALETR